MVGLSFGDLDEDLQRSVFAAITILCLLLVASLVKIVHFIFIGVTGLASLYMAYYLFLRPRIIKSKVKKSSDEKKWRMKN